jgi:glutathione peroxidase
MVAAPGARQRLWYARRLPTRRKITVPQLHDFTVHANDGSERALSEYKDTVCLVVNVASKCGLTPQYDGLQRLHERLAGRGFSVLAFPCNQFAGQEPGSDAEIAEFCATNYGVSFPLFAKTDVNGDARSPLYAWLTSEDTEPDGPGDVKWNFAKFLVDRSGAVVARFEPQTEPEAPEVTQAIESALG